MTNSDWIQKIGLLPVDFLHNQAEDQNVSAMLDGSFNNFCIGYNSMEMMNPSFRDKVWSANMSNYLLIDNDNVKLYNIYRDRYEEISINTIERDYQRFYSYLLTKPVRRGDDILGLVLRQFKLIRSNLREEESAKKSLQILLYVLSKLESSIDINWELPIGTNEYIESIPYLRIEDHIEELKQGLKGLNVKPNVDLILRHTAGALFQEANYIAHFPPQLSLFPDFEYRVEKNPNLIGAHFTPSYIARTIVENTLKYIDLTLPILTIFDPACGSGVFLAECLRQLKNKRYQGYVKVIGWDIDELAIDMAKFVLGFEKAEWGNRLTYTINQCDSIERYEAWPNANILLMNPPYVSWYRMSQIQRDKIAEIMGESLNKPNLAVIFYFLAVEHLADGGCLGCLLPTTYLTADSAFEIRKETSKVINPLLIGQLGNYVFSSAYVDVCMIVAKKGDERFYNTTRMLWTKNAEDITSGALRALRRFESDQYVEIHKDYNIYQEDLRHMKANDLWIPLSVDGLKIRCRIINGLEQKRLVRVGDIFEILQGGRTGANDVFIISQEVYELLPKKEKKYFRPSVDNPSIQNGRLEAVNYLFFPYPEQQFEIENENDLEKEIPFFYTNYLLPNKAKLQSRSGINPEKWWCLTRPRPWQYEFKTKIVSTEFGKSGSFSIDKVGNYVVERGLCWRPLNDNLNICDYYSYLSILNSKVFDRLLSIYSRQLAGGAYNLEAKYVKSIPLPNFDCVDENIIKLLSTSGNMLINKGINLSEDIENVIKKIYGM